MSMTDDELAKERYYERQERNARRCQCAGAKDWPGHCPGPAYCPCCQTDEEEGE
jgi:hypothetical protein